MQLASVADTLLCLYSCCIIVCLPQVHSRWLNLWARRIMASPEQALVPLKERDALLASKHEVRGTSTRPLVPGAAAGFVHIRQHPVVRGARAE